MTRCTVAVDAITARPGNRDAGGFDEDKLNELAASIADLGILQPLLVRRTGADRYELVAGERRLRASRIAALTEVPVTVMDDAGDVDVELAAIIENVQRADVHPLDESDAYQRLRALGLPVARIVERVGRSRPHVDGRLRLQKLIGPIREYWIKDGLLDIGAADRIARLPDVHQGRLWKKLQKDTRILDGSGLRWWIESTTDLLIHAPFGWTDEHLTSAPACRACPKRFGIDSIPLFDNGEPSKDERCGDPGCWKAKVKAHVDRSRTALARTDTDYVESGSRKGQIKPYEWYEVSTDPEVVAAAGYGGPREPDPEIDIETFLVTDGPEAGKVVEGQRQPTRGGIQYQERDWEAERREAEARKAAHHAQRAPLFRMFAAHIMAPDRDVTAELLHRELLECLAGMAMRNSSAGMGAVQAALGFTRDPDHGWHEAHEAFLAHLDRSIDEHGTGALIRFILLALAAQHMDRTNHQGEERDGFDLLVHLLDRAGLPWRELAPDPIPDGDDDSEHDTEDYDE